MADSGLDRPRARRAVLIRLLLALLAPLLLLAAVEFLVASLGVAPPERDPLLVWNPNRQAELASRSGEFREDPRWLWEPRPGAQTIGGPVNEGAYRGPYYPEPRSARRRIALLGDSTTYGFGLAESAAWGRQLENGLRAAGRDVEVLNFGCVGHTVAQGLALYRGRVARYRPEIVVAAFGAVNDGFPALPGRTDEEKMALVASAGYRARLFFRRYDAFRWLEAQLDPLPHEEPAVDPKTVTRRVPLEVFARCVRDLHAAVEETGATLVLILPPCRLDGERERPAVDEYDAALRRAAAERGIVLVDVRQAFRAAETVVAAAGEDPVAAARRSELFIDPWHPSAKGHAVYAAAVGEALVRAGLLDP